MADEPEDLRTMKEKALFYTTAFFVLLGTFSLFAFLFLVPFVIEPAFTTIFMQFDESPAWCVTVEVEQHKGVSNCSWTSCREGCTKEVYECTQIRVNYKTAAQLQGLNRTADDAAAALPPDVVLHAQTARFERALREYDYLDGLSSVSSGSEKGGGGMLSLADELAGTDAERSELYLDMDGSSGAQTPGGNDSEWFFSGARLFPNVKGCGYPPMLNCSIWSKKYKAIGTNYTCYYSRVDPSLVISDLDMHKNTMNLVYAMAIPIPSFIISVIYLTFAYFMIYNEDEETAPLGKNAEEIADEDPQNAADGDGEDEGDDDDTGHTGSNGLTGKVIKTTSSRGTIGDYNAEEEADSNGAGVGDNSTGSEPLTTPNSDEIASFGHQLQVRMADEMSRASLDGGFMSQSASFQG